MKRCYLLAACLLVAVCFSAAYGQQITKEKRASGRFPADKGKLVIDNRYGKLHVNTWDKNEVAVYITITAKAKSESDAQKILDRVSIVQPQGAGIHYKTVIARDNGTRKNSEFRIDYVINMPRHHIAEFNNKFGDIEIPDLDGKLKIDLEYGNLQTGTLKGKDKDIKLGFSNATIASIEAGNITASYSRLSIEKAGDIKVSNQFEKTTIGTVRNLDISQKYGDLKITSVHRLNLNVQYGDLFIGNLQKSATMKVNYCSNVTLGSIGAEVDPIEIRSSFSNLDLRFDKTANLSADVAVSFGNFKSDIANTPFSKVNADRVGNTTSYKGRIGGGQGSLSLDVSYGNVRFR